MSNVIICSKELSLKKRRISIPPQLLAPLVLLIFTILAFGLLVPKLGFYWDDWAKILVSRLFGLSRYVAYYAEDRPLSAWTHILFTPLLGTSPLAWQIFALTLRWLSAWGFYACLKQIWPSAFRQNLAAALLFLVYPAFTQQPAAVTFFQQWLQYALFFFSLYGMLRAAQSAGRRVWAWSVGALLAMFLQFSITEYFVPIELVRPLALWLLFANQAGPLAPQKTRLLRVLKYWATYLVSLAAYTSWRLFFIRLPGEDPYQANTLYDLLHSPLDTLSRLMQIVMGDLLQILVNSWTALLTLKPDEIQPFTLFALGIALLAAGLVVLFLLRAPEPEESGRKHWIRQALALGLLALLLGPVPAWITGRQVVFDFHSDRYALPALFGASLVWVAVVEWIAQRSLQRALLVGLLLLIAASLQLRTANDYRWVWTNQMRIYWQLAWRAPGLQAPTALFFEKEPFPNQGLFSTSAAINLLYPQPGNLPLNPDTGERELGYWVYTLIPRFTDRKASDNMGLSTRFRTLKFSGDTSNSLLLYYNPQVSNCLWVLSPRDVDNPYISDLTRNYLMISDPTRILTTRAPGYPPQDMFGAEPAHTWCYFFEQADLARQLSDWEEVVHLGDEAQALGYSPDRSGSDSPYEWMPFIAGYANSDRWKDAADLTLSAFKKDARYGKMFCSLWSSGLSNWSGAADSEVSQVYRDVQASLGCQSISQMP